MEGFVPILIMLGLGTGFPGARKFRQLLSVDIHKAKDPLALLTAMQPSVQSPGTRSLCVQS